MRDEDIRAGFDTLLRTVRETAPPAIPVLRRRLRRRRVRLAAGFGGAAVIVLTLGVLAVQAGSPSGGVAAMVPSVAVTAVSDGQPSQVADGWQSSASYLISSPVSTLTVRGQAGSISVTGTNQQTVSVTETLHYSVTPPDPIRTLTYGALTLGYTCPRERTCGVTYEIHVPVGIAVNADEQAGTIRLTSLAGDVYARSDAGTIDASGLSGHDVTLQDQAGSVVAGFTAPPTDLEVSAAAGDVSLGVPGDVAYRVTVSTMAGHNAVDVRQSDSSPYRIAVSAGAGAVSISPGNPASVSLAPSGLFPSCFPFCGGSPG